MPPRKPNLVGAQVPFDGGPAGDALPYARRVGAQAVQIFLGNPRGWAPALGDPAADAAFAEACAGQRLPVFVHASHLINLGSPQLVTQERSRLALRRTLARAAALDAAGVVLHPGSVADPNARDQALVQVRESLLPVLEAMSSAPGTGLRLLIEPMPAGAGNLAATVDDLEPYLAALDLHPRLGVCLDTCHAYAAGHDLAAPGGVRRTLNLLVKVAGRDRLGLVHANDSRDPLGSGRDRHAPIGGGMIGLDPFAELFVHPATRGVPIIIETPGGPEHHQRDLQSLKRLRDGAR